MSAGWFIPEKLYGAPDFLRDCPVASDMWYAASSRGKNPTPANRVISGGRTFKSEQDVRAWASDEVRHGRTVADGHLSGAGEFRVLRG